MKHTAITIQGNILSHELLDKLATDSTDILEKKSTEEKRKLREEIALAWSESRLLWKIYIERIQKLEEGETGTSQTTQLWMIPFFQLLGFTVSSSGKAEEIDGQSYNITHRASNLNGFPIIIMGYNESLDKKPESRKLRMSPHALMQEYLNLTDHLYGIISNGKSLRILRDSNRITTLAYIEFDLQRIFEEELYAEFAILYKLVHASNMPQSPDEAEKCIIETYHQDSIASGTRIRDQLRDAVQQAMQTISRGFLEHPDNSEFVTQIKEGSISALEFHRLLLRLVYRIIFLATIEERNLIFPPLRKDHPDFDDMQRKRSIYESFYSIERLRKLAESTLYVPEGKSDYWQSLLTTFRLFEPTGYGEKLGIQPLDGALFSENGLRGEHIHLDELKLDNAAFLEFFRHLSLFRDERGIFTRINYRDLGVEELGSVYEALLELHPVFRQESGHIIFTYLEGAERKTTGSYYTRHDLVGQLIKSALIPVMEQRLREAGQEKEARERALLSIKVVDPAAGSGHFLIAAARTLGFELAKIRSGEENPGTEFVQQAIRDVIDHCIYGVDKNPAAVELCRLSLWLVGHNQGKPLNFLEHKIKVGDSLIGVDKLERLWEGIPDGAFDPTTGDDKKTATKWKKENKKYRDQGLRILGHVYENIDQIKQKYAGQYKGLVELQSDTIQDNQKKEEMYRKLMYNPEIHQLKIACDLYTYAIFQKYEAGSRAETIVTSEFLERFLSSNGSSNAQLEAKAIDYSEEQHFFHWPLEFPDVFEQGGFDVVLGNPPWERIKLQEKEFFATRDTDIAQAANKAARKRLIEQLPERNPDLWKEYSEALHYSECASKFLRKSPRYPLTGRGDINLYSVFAELMKNLLNQTGRAGLVVPTGIATDDTNKFFFADLVQNNQLVSLYDFENRKAIFPNVHRSYKFSLLTINGGSLPENEEPSFAFFLLDVLDLQDKRRVFSLNREDFEKINPNTLTCPIFRTRQDAELTRFIYDHVPVLVNERKNQNPWGVKFLRMFDMSLDSHLFRTREQLEKEGYELVGNRFVKGDDIYLPLYESKMIWQYDHRFGTYEGVIDRNSTHLPHPTEEQLKDPNYVVQPWYWVSEKEVKLKQNYYWIFRKIVRSNDERSFIQCFSPKAGFGDSILILLKPENIIDRLKLSIIVNSLVFDYIVRLKISGINMSFFFVYQFPILAKEQFKNFEKYILDIIELIYTSFDIKSVYDDLIDIFTEIKTKTFPSINNKIKINRNLINAYKEIRWDKYLSLNSNFDVSEYYLLPFEWNQEKRNYIRAELDAYLALLYGLERKQLRYILDPADLTKKELENILDPWEEVEDPLDEEAYRKRCAESTFPGETFRVLKEKETKEYGEYRTRRLVLEAYNRLRCNGDMEAHRKKLKEIWKKYQEDLSGQNQATSPSGKKKSPTASQKKKLEDDGQGRLF